MRSKKRTILLFVFILAANLCAWAQDFNIDGINYYITNNSTHEVAVTSGGNYVGDIVIPSSVEDSGIKYTVTSIEQSAFRECWFLTSISLPVGVTSIGEAAFGDCSSLTSIGIPSGVTSIEGYVFFDCSSLTSISLPAGLTSIGNNAFNFCSSLTSISLPSGVTSIGEFAFEDCSSLTSITLPAGLKSIDDGTFHNCSSLASIDIPSGVTSIGGSAFNGCSSLTSISLPDGLTSIGKSAFVGCSSLTSIDIPAGVTSVGEWAFYGCSSLTSISLPAGLKNIDDGTFSDCSSLTSISLPAGLTTIGGYVFSGCSSLTSIDIPAGVTSVGEYAFDGCSSLTSISLPVGLTDIGRNAFRGCSVLSLIKCLGSEVADFYIFYNNLLRLYNNSIFIVNEGLFEQYASSPEWSEYINRLISADMLQLKTVNLTAVENSSSLFDQIGNDSKYVANLKINGTINGYDIMAIRNKFIRLIDLDLSDADIVANDGGYEYYPGCSIQSDNVLGKSSFSGLYLRKVVLPKSLESIDQEAFYNCTNLNEVVMSDNLIAIAGSAFVGCQSLYSVDLPQSLLSIGNSAFQSVPLKHIVLPGSLLEIGPKAFAYCNLSGVLRIPSQLTVINQYAFRDTQIDTLILGSNVSEIAGGAFRGCSNLKEITFNRKLIKVGADAFTDCRNLQAASLPYSVEVIDDRAFQNCSSLESIKIPSMTKRIGNEAFGGCDNIKNVYTYTVEPTQINQQTFSVYRKAMLNVPKTSRNLYIYNTQWSQFLDVQEFDEPYDAFYLNGDVELDDRTGRMSGEPDADMYETSGFIVEGDETQELSSIELQHNGTNGASIIGSLGSTSSSTSNLTAKSMNVNISVDGNRWYFFCFPFDVARDSIECSTDYVFYSYDGGKRANAGSGWTKLDPVFTSLQKGLGYIFQASRTGILTIHVSTDYLTFNATDERDQLTSFTSSDAANAHWNFIGNPYISYYDVQDLAKEYDAPIVVWNGRGYDVYKPGDDDYQLKPFEAFFVQKETGTSYVEFLPENRITYNQATTRASLRAAKRASLGTPISLDRQLVNITIMDSDSVTDKTRIVYSTKAAMDYEIGVDAAKFQSDGVPQIYTLNGTTKYAINERPMGTDDIKLGYTAPKSGTYTLSIPRKDAEVEIYDNVTKSKVDFTFGDYVFETKVGTFNDRFVIHKTSGGITAVENGFRLDGLTVTATNGGLDIEGSMAGKVKVYSESGILLAEPSRAGRIELGDGVYIIKVGDISIKLDVL